MTYTIHTGLFTADAEPLRFERDGQPATLADFLPVPDGPLHLFGVSGGKDSGALFLWAMHQSGLPRERLVFTFADTGNEHPATYEQLAHLDRLHPVWRLCPALDFWGLVAHKRLFPSRKKRFCTQYLKMQPARRVAHALVNAGYEVKLYSGVRAAESEARRALPELEWDGYFALPVVRPLLRWKLRDVLDLHTRHGLPLNPLYAWGARRVGCFPCINSVKSELRLLPQHGAATLDRIRAQERAFRAAGKPATFFHRNTVPPRFRTEPVVTKTGQPMLVASIDDVLRWAAWESARDVAAARRAQARRDNWFPEDADLACPSSLGACE